MTYFFVTDITDKQRELFRFADRLTVGIIAVTLIGIILWIVYLAVIGKNNTRSKQFRRNPKDYTEAEGVITGIQKVTYSVAPYQRKRLHLEDLDDDKLFGRKKAEEKRREREKYQKEYVSPSDEKAEPIEKTRCDVEYEFRIPDDDRVYRGEFSVYSESDEIAVGKSVAVMYNPTKPEANYTKYNSPIGRY